MKKKKNIKTLDIIYVSPILPQILSLFNLNFALFYNIDDYKAFANTYPLFNPTQDLVILLTDLSLLFILSQQPSVSQLVVHSGWIARESCEILRKKLKAQLEMEL